MRKTPFSNDARLWSYLIDEFRQAGVTGTAQLERHARRAVAVVRRDRDQEPVTSWAPGDEIPATVVWVYDLEGDVWERQPGGRWKMTGFDADDTELAAGDEYDDADLLDRYGPVTGVPKPGPRGDRNA